MVPNNEIEHENIYNFLNSLENIEKLTGFYFFPKIKRSKINQK